MSEPTLSLAYPDLAAAIGDFAGYGPGSYFGETTWTTLQAGRLDRTLKAGVRSFYKPTPLYDWSFLHLYQTFAVVAGATQVFLPDDCAGIEGDIIVGQADNGTWCPRIRLTNPQWVKTAYAQDPTGTGQPRIAAIEQLKGPTLLAGQRQQLVFYPAADAAYLLQFQYYVVPDAPAPAPPADSVAGTANNDDFPGVVTGQPYVYGGAVHAETVKEACLAQWEMLYDDIANGPHKMAFMEQLAGSMAADRRSKGQYLGKNRDTSDDRGRSCRSFPSFPTSVIYNGESTN